MISSDINYKFNYWYADYNFILVIARGLNASMLVKTSSANRYCCHLDTFSKVCFGYTNRIICSQICIETLFDLFTNLILSHSEK